MWLPCIPHQLSSKEPLGKQAAHKEHEGGSIMNGNLVLSRSLFVVWQAGEAGYIQRSGFRKGQDFFKHELKMLTFRAAVSQVHNV